MRPALKQLLLLLALLGAAASLRAQGTAFTYQGRLNDNGAPATGLYDLRFTIYDSGGGATVTAGPLTSPAVPVSNGLFTVVMDFGIGVFTGPARWLQIEVRTNGGAAFAPLNPRQALTPAPYAIHAGTAATASTASNVVNGAAVKSLNNLRDNITLAAGANVTLTPSGNTLTISSTGGGGETNSLWARNGANAYYNAGNVGIGTSTPNAPLYVVSQSAGLADNTATFYAPGIGLNASHIHYGSSGDWLVRSASGSGKVVLQDSGGNVGIGTANPSSKLHVQGDEFLSGNAYFGSSTRQMLNLYGTGFGIGVQDAVLYQRSGGAFYWFQGGTHQNATGNAGGGLSLLSLDQLGIHFGARLGQFLRLYEDDVNYYGSGVQAGTHYFRTGAQPGDAFAWHKGGVHNDSPRNPGGGQTLMTLDGENGLAVSGNATQPRDKGGFVKAMAKVNADGTIARQYSALGGVITAAYSSESYVVTFPFQVDDRFISVTPLLNGSLVSVPASVDPYPCFQCTPSSVRVYFGTQATFANAFFIFVY